ncbi:MAG: CRISPR-associated protein Cas4 [Clostridia bacterium]|nr:CRISPR-associated protein Cas4 [Clostridia bacterium]
MTKEGYDEDSLLPLSGIQHIAFCERQWALIHIERQWLDNVRTVEGHFMHERAHDSALYEDDGDHITTRAVPLMSRRLGLYGQADVVEFWPVENGAKEGALLPGHEGLWLPKPVEYKRGKPKSDDRDQVQLCAQAMCLEEMLGAQIAAADLYYGEPRRRQRVALDEQLRRRVEELSSRMHTLFEAGITPPASKGKHCELCSLADVCLPGLTLSPHSAEAFVRKQVRACREDDAKSKRP